MKFTVDQTRTPDEVHSTMAPYVICAEGHPVLERRPNGQVFHMTYRTQVRAELGLCRAQADLPHAVVYTYEPPATDADVRPFGIKVRAATAAECAQTDGMANPIDGAAAVEVDGRLVGITNEYGTCCFPPRSPSDATDIARYERLEQLVDLATTVWSDHQEVTVDA